MKTPVQIDVARDVVIRHLARSRLTELERATLGGMSVALQWVVDQGGIALRDLIEGRETRWDYREKGPVA